VEVERLIYQDNRNVSLARVVLVAASISATVGMTLWARFIAEDKNTDENQDEDDSTLYVYILAAVFLFLLLLFGVYDWLIARRTTKLVINAAKTSELVTAMFPGQFRGKILEQTRAGKGDQYQEEKKESEGFLSVAKPWLSSTQTSLSSWQT
jgi:H+/Cl- antiporter ClcA